MEGFFEDLLQLLTDYPLHLATAIYIVPSPNLSPRDRDKGGAQLSRYQPIASDACCVPTAGISPKQLCINALRATLAFHLHMEEFADLIQIR